MDILKLIYEHDIRLDELKERPANRKDNSPEFTLEDFMKPDPTYSKFYFTGTKSDESQYFGLNKLDYFEEVLEKLNEALNGYYFLNKEKSFTRLSDAIANIQVGEPLLATQQENAVFDEYDELTIDDHSNIGHRKMALRNALKAGWLVIYKEKAHHGFDLHLFSEENIYRSFFYPLKELTGGKSLRFFSMNGKRITSERKFYFETWTLHRPPHGAEEVLPQTVLP